ncbi:MAG: type 4a pilus biogenesis protein PilO [Planctomycetes bacterium]|nr:type 4a pilus biogenesis protein PilO [Planctomycetota bacterium]
MKTDALLEKGWHIDALGAALCVALAAGVYLAGVEPLIHRQDVYAAQLKVLEAEQDRAGRLEQTLKTVQAHLVKVQRDAAEGTLRLRPLATATLHVAEISQLAADSGLQLDDIQTAAAIPGEYAVAVPVRLSGTGTYTACTLFLARLRRALPETCVVSLTLADRGQQPASPAVFEMDLRWHAAREGAAPSAGASQALSANPPNPEPET